ncbi:hypothetical protein [Nocardia wallacei]|uniref:hypothetical protein n=1 Tax=Nocardia wallacei TaxID=480035 RepID=UPI002453FA8E|nr:hypothetical protein [Nocardia wallacei]
MPDQTIPLTDDDLRKIRKSPGHHWTVRVLAAELLATRERIAQPGQPTPKTLAEHIVVDRARHTITIDGEQPAWDIAEHVWVAPVPDDQPAEVAITVIAERATIDARGELTIDGDPLRWHILEPGAVIVVGTGGTLLVSIMLLAERITEIPADTEAARHA